MSCLKSIAVLSLTAAIIVAVASKTRAQQPLPAEGDEAQLLAILRSDAELFEKAKACQQLAVVGGPQAVPVLVPLLADEQLAHYARFALEPIDDPAVDRALRDALRKLEGGLLVGVIDSLGMRRDAPSVEHLITLLAADDADVASAAAGALGRIATEQAVTALRGALEGAPGVRIAAADACLTAAELLAEQDRKTDAMAVYKALHQADVPNHVQTAALYGASLLHESAGLEIMAAQLQSDDPDRFAVALQIAQHLQGKQATEALVARMGDLTTARQALLIHVLGERGDKSALPVVLRTAGHDQDEIRLAAIDALSTLGDATAVPVLLDAALAEATAETAFDSLASLPGADIDEALAGMLSSSDGPRRLMLIRLAGARGIQSASPTLLRLADSSQAEVQLAAIQALGLTVQLDDLSALVERMFVDDQTRRDAAKESLKKACQRLADRDAGSAVLLEHLAAAPVASKGDLLELLGIVGGQKALSGVSAAARDGAEPVQDAASRVLGQWSSPAAAPMLLELAKSGNERFQTRSLRGYIRIIRQFGLPAEERLAMCREALSVAQRADEEQLVLDTLTRIPSPDSLALAMTYIDDDDLKKAAGASAVAIAEKIVNAHPDAVAEAMKKVTEAATERETVGRARVLLRRAGGTADQN